MSLLKPIGFLVLGFFSQCFQCQPSSASTTSHPLPEIATIVPTLPTDQSSPSFVGFVGDPNGRGTASLVISCVLTLLLCVWSALHLNVPEQGQTSIGCFLVNARWIIAGVYAPELVVFTAWRQWSSARILGNIVNDAQGKLVQPSLGPSSLPRPDTANDPNVLTPPGQSSLDDPPTDRFLHVPHNDRAPNHIRNEQGKASDGSWDSSSATMTISASSKETHPNRYEWTMAHGSFASTGGFAFEIEPAETHRPGNGAVSSFLPSECSQRLTLTARGMALLARCGHLPDIAKADITDKSKANDLAKALVMIQASWMLIQVIGRLIAHMPVTLLEVNTIAHVVCAFAMYAMWWHKPLAPKEPFVLRGDWVRPLCAYMYMSSEISGEVDPNSIESQTIIKTLFAFLRLYSKVPEIEAMAYQQPSCSEHAGTWNSHGVGAPISVCDPETQHEDPEPGVWPLQKQTLKPASSTCVAELTSKKLGKTAATAFFERRPRVKDSRSTSKAISQIDTNRWTLATAAVDSYPAIRELFLFHAHKHSKCLHFKSEELLVNRVQNWPWDDLLRDVGGLVVGMILWLACFVYGAIHLSAWNGHFPSVAEQWLWRSSSLYIGFCGGLWIVLNYIAQSYGPLNAFWEKWMDGGGRRWQNILISAPVVVCGLSLIFARAFIVVEAFVSIRELPSGAYDTPTWTQVFPHF